MASVPPSVPETLTSPMQQPVFLRKIFECLLDYGLQDCRLVCRQWYAVCQHFPVRLGEISPENLDALTCGFPNAVSLTMQTSYWDDEICVWTKQLALFRDLRNVTWKMRDLWDNRRIEPIFGHLKQLKRLDLILEKSNLTLQEYSSLRCLTNLTMLTLLGQPVEEWGDVDPFVELTAVRVLRVAFEFFMNHNRRCQFPSLPSLTELTVLTPACREHYPLYNAFLEAIGSYSSTLETLHLFWSPLMMTEALSYAPLLSLRRLKTLTLAVEFTVRDEVLHRTLKQMVSLENLSLRGLFQRDSIGVEELISLFSFRWLKSLTIESLRLSGAEPFPLGDELTQLTKLALTVSIPVGEMLMTLPQLMHLELTIECHFNVGLTEALVFLTNLQTLCIRGHKRRRKPVFSSQPLSGLLQLRSLELDRVLVDRFVFREMASLSKMAALRFRDPASNDYPYFFLYQINLLKHLEDLEVELPGDCRISGYLFPNHLCNLKRLTTSGTEEQLQLLCDRFSVNPWLTINPRPSRWLSPLAD